MCAAPSRWFTLGFWLSFQGRNVMIDSVVLVGEVPRCFGGVEMAPRAGSFPCCMRVAVTLGPAGMVTGGPDGAQSGESARVLPCVFSYPSSLSTFASWHLLAGCAPRMPQPAPTFPHQPRGKESASCEEDRCCPARPHDLMCRWIFNLCLEAAHPPRRRRRVAFKMLFSVGGGARHLG